VKRILALAVAMVAAMFLVAPSPGLADPDDETGGQSDEPTLSEISDKVDDLHHQAEVVAERMNEIKIEVADAEKRLEVLQADLGRQQSKVDALRAQVVGQALEEFQNGGGLSTSTSFLVSDDPRTFLDNLANSAVADSQQAAMLVELSQLEQQLGAQEEQAQAEVDAIAEDQDDLAAKQKELDDKTAEAEAILAELEQEQIERLARMQDDAPPAGYSPSRDDTRTNPHDIPASERAQVAVQVALAQVGDPYVYGAAGPDAFDCSGLTMYAWGQAGVSIPHASSAQPGAGTPVSLSSLMPGDLVFYYSPISHVGMYIGNGQIVHAPNPSRSVEVVPMNLMPIAMAVRIG
jgi:cell wall-associated NlpC family hydrolase